MMTDNKNALMHECYQFVTIDAEKGKYGTQGRLPIRRAGSLPVKVSPRILILAQNTNDNNGLLCLQKINHMPLKRECIYVLTQFRTVGPDMVIAQELKYR